MMRVVRVLACLFALSGGAPTVRAQDLPPKPPAETAPPEEKKLDNGQLEQLVAPIALYPDDLIAQVLMASTYPLEIVEAARWAKKPENAKLKGEALDKALAAQSWDTSVKSLVPFPTVLTNMDEKLDWTQQLGDAFLEQQKDVMDAIQRLRKKAQDAGNLKSNEQQTVKTETAPDPVTKTETQVIIIEPANPQVVYVPTYQPTVVYGTWGYPAYPPYYWPAPPGAYFASGFFWGAAIGVSAAYWGGASCGWHSGDIDINNNTDINIDRGDRNTNIDRGDRGRGIAARSRSSDRGQGGGKWQHDASHRKGVSYKDAKTADRFNKGGGSAAASRDNYRGRTQGGAGPGDRGGSSPGGGPGNRDLGASPKGGAGNRDLGSSPKGGAGNRDLGSSSKGGAFDRSGGGSSARASSARGSSSMGSRGGGYSGGSRGGGGRGGGGGGRGGGGRGGGRR